MKGLRLPRWSQPVLVQSRRAIPIQSPYYSFHRCQATAAIPLDPIPEPDRELNVSTIIPEDVLQQLPSPPVSAAKTSAKLSALHARISLPTRLPVQTLARTLVDSSADSSIRFNNKSLAILGGDLLSYYTAEYIIAQYPRLPQAVVFAAMYAYAGPKALAAITREWGVEFAAEPGGEVDPGFLQFRRAPAEPKPEIPKPQVVSGSSEKRSISSRSVYDNAFGEIEEKDKSSSMSEELQGITAEKACTNFVRAVVGAVYLHAGRIAAKQFYRDHFMSRQLNMADLFQFRYPTRDLSRLCLREGFAAPVARIESETGRKSRHPVFIVGVYSGNEKLGEGAGSSLAEARTRASVAALKGWYLYSPTEFRLPSEMEEQGAKPWTSIMVDPGDIVV